MKKLFKKILDWFRHHHMYVIADGSDNSITLSRALFHHMGGMELTEAKVFAFYIPDNNTYGFVLNPQFNEETQLADIQYNEKYKTIGFAMLNPSVARMYYDYQMPALIKAKLNVKAKTAGDITYYEICPPTR